MNPRLGKFSLCSTQPQRGFARQADFYWRARIFLTKDSRSREEQTFAGGTQNFAGYGTPFPDDSSLQAVALVAYLHRAIIWLCNGDNVGGGLGE
jgi:hypothetical protein